MLLSKGLLFSLLSSIAVPLETSSAWSETMRKRRKVYLKNKNGIQVCWLVWYEGVGVIPEIKDRRVMNLPILWAPLMLRNKITAHHLWQHKSTCHLLWDREVVQTRRHGYSTVSGNFSALKINGDSRHRAPWEIQTMMDSKSRAKVSRQKTLWRKRRTARCAFLNIKMTLVSRLWALSWF